MSQEVKTPLVVQAPLFPTYAELGEAIKALQGEPIRRVRDMISAVWDQTGTPQSPVDWSEPDKWIPERLSGELQALARKIWEGSKKVLNPRYLYGSYLFVNRLELLTQHAGTYELNDRSKKFLSGDEQILRELDADEGLPKILSLIAERSPSRRGDILPAWSDYLKAVSPFATPTTFSDTLRRRINNLVERRLVSREGNFYSIADQGLEWLKGFKGSSDGKNVVASQKRTIVAEAARSHNEEQLKAFKGRLMGLEAAQFENFVKELLDAMDYENVRVTKVSGDKRRGRHSKGAIWYNGNYRSCSGKKNRDDHYKA